MICPAPHADDVASEQGDNDGADDDADGDDDGDAAGAKTTRGGGYLQRRALREALKPGGIGRVDPSNIALSHLGKLWL